MVFLVRRCLLAWLELLVEEMEISCGLEFHGQPWSFEMSLTIQKEKRVWPSRCGRSRY